MARRTRRFSRRFAGRSSKTGRRMFWLRFTPFNIALREAATATHSDILLSPSDYWDPEAQLNETRRGAPRLERLILQFGLSVHATNVFWSATGSGNVALIPELLVWKQSDQFVTSVTGNTTFNATRENQRVLFDGVPRETSWQFTQNNAGNNSSIRSTMLEADLTSKVNLKESSLGVAWRGLFNTGDAALTGYTDWFRPTMLISTP